MSHYCISNKDFNVNYTLLEARKFSKCFKFDNAKLCSISVRERKWDSRLFSICLNEIGQLFRTIRRTYFYIGPCSKVTSMNKFHLIYMFSSFPSHSGAKMFPRSFLPHVSINAMRKRIEFLCSALICIGLGRWHYTAALIFM